MNFFFPSSSAVEFSRKASLTSVGFTSQVGGLVGLFMGFSFPSGVEIAYWFTYRLASNVAAARRGTNGRSKLGAK